jgi:hypothetical protein
MDDNQFDDIVKRKVGEYEEPGFDPAALSDLHYRMAASDAVPWYFRYRSELLVGTGLAICTLIILWNQWSLSNKQSLQWRDDLTSPKEQQEQIFRLQNEINYLKTIQPDTIRVIEYKEQNSTLYTVLLNRIANLQADLENYRNRSLQDMVVGSDSLESDNVLTRVAGANPSDNSSRLVPRQTDGKSARAQWDKQNNDIEVKQRSLSVKSLRDIEDHYQKGIGIRVGPTVEMSKGVYSQGKGHFDIAGGLLGDFILSPSISIETGGKYVHRVYSISDQADLANKTFPQVEGGLGPPKNVDIDSWILEVPVNLKYRYPLSLKTHWLTGIGYSSMLFTRQILEYDYTLSGNSSASIYSAFKKDKPELYSGAINFSLGLSNETKRKNIIETSVYYQHGLGNIGAEATQRSFIGVRSVYWFKIK